MPFVYFSCLWLGLLVLFGINVSRGDEHPCLVPDLKRGLAFHWYDVTCEILICGLYYAEVHFVYTRVIEIMLNPVKYFSASIETIKWFLFFILLKWYIRLIVCKYWIILAFLEYLFMVYDLSNALLNLVYVILCSEILHL